MKQANIVYDENPESPREWDNLSTMAFAHNSYDFGDKDAWEELASEIGKYVHPNKVPDVEDYQGLVSLAEQIPGFVVLPVYMYDHSGVTISTSPFSCPWDSGQLGVAFVSPDKVKDFLGRDIDEAELKDMISSEVKELDDYLTGSTFGVIIVDENDPENVTDSCYGFYGNDHKVSGVAEYIKEMEATKVIDETGSDISDELFKPQSNKARLIDKLKR